jgi:hypothetical protein
MKVVSMHCTNCGATVSIESKFCAQCGAPIVVDDGTKRSEHIIHHFDEARIREAESKELIRLKELELEIKRENAKSFFKKALLAVILVSIICLFTSCTISNIASDYIFWNRP